MQIKVNLKNQKLQKEIILLKMKKNKYNKKALEILNLNLKNFLVVYLWEKVKLKISIKKVNKI